MFRIVIGMSCKNIFNIILWFSGLRPCSWIGGYERLGVICCFHLQGWSLQIEELVRLYIQKASSHENKGGRRKIDWG
jgi:hypothetical protein